MNVQNYVPRETGVDLKRDRIAHEHEVELDLTGDLARDAKDKLAQAERQVIETRARLTDADSTVQGARAKAKLLAVEAEKLALQAELEAREEERREAEAERENERRIVEAERRAVEAERKKERLEYEAMKERFQEMEAQLRASSNCELPPSYAGLGLANRVFPMLCSEVIMVSTSSFN